MFTRTYRMHHCIAEEVAQITLPFAAVGLGQVDQGAPNNDISKHIDFLFPGLQCLQYVGVCRTGNNESYSENTWSMLTTSRYDTRAKRDNYLHDTLALT